MIQHDLFCYVEDLEKLYIFKQIFVNFFNLGARRMIDVFDCDTHSPEKMTVHQFVRYYMSEEKEKLLNVTSLEFSQTGLDRLVDCPVVVSFILL